MVQGELKLEIKIPQTSDDFQAMRFVRNSCRTFMTRNQDEISERAQEIWFRKLDKNIISPFLFTYGEEVAGYGLVRKMDGKKWLTGGLLPNFRHLGLGEKLFELLMDVAGKPTWLEVRAENEIAKAVYFKLGFREVFNDGIIVTMAHGVTIDRPHVPKPIEAETVSTPITYSQPVVAEPLPPLTPAEVKQVSVTMDASYESLPLETVDRKYIKVSKNMLSRIFISTINYDHPQRGMRWAFDSLYGKDKVSEYDYLEMERRGKSRDEINQGFLEQAIAHEPDWCFLQLQNTGLIEADTLRKLKEKLPNTMITHWMGDARPDIGAYLASICRATDITFISSVGQKDMYLAAGAKRVEYMQIGLDWEEDVLGLPDWTPPFEVPEVVFIGNYYGGTFPGTDAREGAIRHLHRNGVKVGIVGNGWPGEFPVVGSCGVKQQHHVWKRAKIGLSINNFNNIESYYSDRHIIAMAAGIPVVCQYVPGLQNEFENEKHCIWFHNNNELLAHVTRLLGDEDLRKKIGRDGRNHVMRHHTWISRVFDAHVLIKELSQRA